MQTSYKINDFEGPLDLLLHLIKENKMDILDIEIMTLISQYLEYVEQAKNINLEIAADFLVMASTLVEIKSKVLLPKPEIEIDDEYEEDTQEQLIKRLLEYKRYQEVTNKLKEYNEERNLIYIKNVEDLSKYHKEDNIVDLPKDIELYDLIKSMDKIMQRLKIKQPLNSVLENTEISVEDRCDSLLNQLKSFNKANVNLEELIDVASKSYLVVTFLAILDLAKRNLIEIKQSNNFNEIIIREVI